MKRRTFLKITAGILLFPKLIVTAPDKFFVSSGTAMINGSAVDFVEYNTYGAQLWVKNVYNECKEKSYFSVILGDSKSHPLQVLPIKQIGNIDL